jgi:hypothetical protein
MPIASNSSRMAVSLNLKPSKFESLSNPMEQGQESAHSGGTTVKPCRLNQPAQSPEEIGRRSNWKYPVILIMDVMLSSWKSASYMIFIHSSTMHFSLQIEGIRRRRGILLMLTIQINATISYYFIMICGILIIELESTNSR